MPAHRASQWRPSLRARARRPPRARARASRRPRRRRRPRVGARRARHGDARGVDVDRRAVALALALALATRAAPRRARRRRRRTDAFDALERRAKRAYEARDLQRAREALTAIIAMEPETPEWRERRAQVLVDMKLFEDAVADYDEAERMYRREVRRRDDDVQVARDAEQSRAGVRGVESLGRGDRGLLGGVEVLVDDRERRRRTC